MSKVNWVDAMLLRLSSEGSLLLIVDLDAL